MKRKPNGYWNNFENCKKEALKYNARSEFAKYSDGAYRKARLNGWLDIICDHMEIKNYLTLEKCKEIASNYASATEMSKKHHNVLTKIYTKGWTKECIGHFVRLGSRYRKCVYAYEFSDNSVYIGITYNLGDRNNDHLNIAKINVKSSVGKHIIKTNLTPKLKQITDYIDVNEAIELEEYYLKEYQKDGWIILNVAKTGAIGGGELKWSYDNCKREALKYKSRDEFKHKSSGAYSAALDKNWIDEICVHMMKHKKHRFYWTHEKCALEALKYDSRMKFKSESSSAYDASVKHKWLDDVCKHMKVIRKSNGYWTYEKCKEIALTYKTKNEFNKKHGSACTISKKNGWYGDITSHMKRKIN